MHFIFIVENIARHSLLWKSNKQSIRSIVLAISWQLRCDDHFSNDLCADIIQGCWWALFNVPINIIHEPICAFNCSEPHIYTSLSILFFFFFFFFCCIKTNASTRYTKVCFFFFSFHHNRLLLLLLFSRLFGFVLLRYNNVCVSTDLKPSPVVLLKTAYKF